MLNADFSCLREVLLMLEKNEVELVHLDIISIPGTMAKYEIR